MGHVTTESHNAIPSRGRDQKLQRKLCEAIEGAKIAENTVYATIRWNFFISRGELFKSGR